MANLFRNENKIFIRALYLFDEMIRDHYYTATCKTFDAVYENQPVIDTIRCDAGVDNAWYIDGEATSFTAERVSDKELCIGWGDKKVIFSPEGMEIAGATLSFSIAGHKAGAKLCGNSINYFYNGRGYTVNVDRGNISISDGIVKIEPTEGKIKLSFAVEG